MRRENLPPPEVEHADTENLGEDQSSKMPEEDEAPSDSPAREKTLEELAREDEKNSGAGDQPHQP